MNCFSNHFTSIIILAFASMMSFSISSSAAPSPDPIPVHYSEETELVSILAHIAGVNGYVFSADDGVIEDYLSDVDNYFAQYSDHKAVKFVRNKLSMRGFAWDFPIAFALRLRIDGNQIIYEQHLDTDFDDYYDRISRKNEKILVRLLQDFYNDTEFHSFFTEHKPLYEECENAMAEVTSRLDIGWYEKFFGPSDGTSFHVFPGLLNGPGNYAVHQKTDDGKEIINALMGCCARDANGKIYYGETYTLPVLIHEFNHSYCNPLNEEFWDAISPAAARIFNTDPAFYASIAYGSPLHVMNETFVEACMIRYLISHPLNLEGTGFNGMDELIECLLDIDEKKKRFLLIRDLADILKEREEHTDIYPTMQDFMPRYVEVVNRRAGETVLE
ncbi:MAG: DUF4932 domain-containing protein [Candidatus Cryptobacteroides sp.]